MPDPDQPDEKPTDDETPGGHEDAPGVMRHPKGGKWVIAKIPDDPEDEDAMFDAIVDALGAPADDSDGADATDGADDEGSDPAGQDTSKGGTS
jgi:hypothetical protein